MSGKLKKIKRVLPLISFALVAVVGSTLAGVFIVAGRKYTDSGLTKKECLALLKRFRDKPLAIDWVHTEPIESTDPQAVQNLRKALVVQTGGMITPSISQEITFQGQLKYGQTTDIIASYRSAQEIISVHEEVSPVLEALKKFNQTNPLAIDWVHTEPIESTDPQAVQNLRKALVVQTGVVITPSISREITFQGQLKYGQTTDIIASYRSAQEKISVHEKVSPVLEALKKFNQTNPLAIDWVHTEPIESTDPQAVQNLRKALVVQTGGAITPSISQEITFQGQLKYGQTTDIIASYRSAQEKIFVHEKVSPVLEALKKLNQTNPLKIKYVTDQDSSKPATTTVLRTALTARDKGVFTPEVVSKMIFRGKLAQGNKNEITVMYHKALVSIYVQEQAMPVLIALKQFNRANPLNLEYISSQSLSVSRPELTTALRRALVRRDKFHIISLTNVQNITFSQANIQPSLSAANPQMLQATYRGISVPIFAYEEYPTPDNIKNTLVKFNWHHPLFLGIVIESFLGQIERRIKTALIDKAKSKYITKLVVKEIKFSNPGWRPIPKGFNIWDLSLVYQKLEIKIFVRTIRPFT